MRALVQRVSRARSTPGGSIGPGLCILLGVAAADSAADADRLAAKIAKLRIFGDEDGRFDRPLPGAGGAAFAPPPLAGGGAPPLASKFTLLADPAKGTPRSFSGAARPDGAEPL